MNESIFVIGKCTITFTGIELRAYDDELVWLEIINLAKNRALGTWIEFTHYQLCKALDWPTSGTYYKKVHECLLRLKATAVALSNDRLGKGKAISFINAYEWASSSENSLRKCRVSIHPDMYELFAGHQFTEVEWSLYRKLSSIARRIYDYIASHRKPYPLKLETIHHMCASATESRERRWKQQVDSALNELKEVGLVKNAEIHGNLVSFER